jgi:hypothetical protein
MKLHIPRRNKKMNQIFTSYSFSNIERGKGGVEGRVKSESGGKGKGEEWKEREREE